MNDCNNFLASSDLKDVILSIDGKETVFCNTRRIVINMSVATKNRASFNEIEIIIEEYIDAQFTCISLSLMEQASLLAVSDYKLIINLKDFKLVFSDISALSAEQIFNAHDEPINKTIIKAMHFSKQPNSALGTEINQDV